MFEMEKVCLSINNGSKCFYVNEREEVVNCCTAQALGKRFYWYVFPIISPQGKGYFYPNSWSLSSSSSLIWVCLMLYMCVFFIFKILQQQIWNINCYFFFWQTFSKIFVPLVFFPSWLPNSTHHWDICQHTNTSDIAGQSATSSQS